MFLFGLMLFVGCSEKKKEKEIPAFWKFSKEIQLDGVSPIGIVAQDDFLWLSDVDNNRIVKIDLEGKIIEEHTGFQRPMHIAIQSSKIYIPEFISDMVQILENGNVSTYVLTEKPDAPGGVAIEGNNIAVADFYNHRILLRQGDKTSTIGKEGHNEGQLYYPTDVELKNNLIYVADAYNNRIQVFDLEGKYVRVIGHKDGIKVATGLKVTDTQVIVADFERHRTLIYKTNCPQWEN